jgi:hypothetical protein
LQSVCVSVLNELAESLYEAFSGCDLGMTVGDRPYPLLFLRVSLCVRLAEPEGDEPQIRQFADTRRLAGWSRPPGLQEFFYATPLSAIALLLQFSPELRSVVTALCPPLLQIFSKRFESGAASAWRVLGEFMGLESATYRFAAETEIPCDGTFSEAAWARRSSTLPAFTVTPISISNNSRATSRTT